MYSSFISSLGGQTLLKIYLILLSYKIRISHLHKHQAHTLTHALLFLFSIPPSKEQH